MSTIRTRICYPVAFALDKQSRSAASPGAPTLTCNTYINTFNQSIINTYWKMLISAKGYFMNIYK